jgi:AraC-like DNA-binding protein
MLTARARDRRPRARAPPYRRARRSRRGCPACCKGLRRGLARAALRGIHIETAHRWTLATLARQAGMSRSSFAERFARVIGMTPLHYLLQWRIAVAKNWLAREQMSVAETALAPISAAPRSRPAAPVFPGALSASRSPRAASRFLIPPSGSIPGSPPRPRHRHRRW